MDRGLKTRNVYLPGTLVGQAEPDEIYAAAGLNAEGTERTVNAALVQSVGPTINYCVCHFDAGWKLVDQDATRLAFQKTQQGVISVLIRAVQMQRGRALPL